MADRATELAVELAPLLPAPELEISPRDALGQHYADQMLAAFRGLHAVTGELATHLESGGDPSVFLAKAHEFDALVKATGAAMLALGHLFTSDGTA